MQNIEKFSNDYKIFIDRTCYIVNKLYDKWCIDEMSVSSIEFNKHYVNIYVSSIYYSDIEKLTIPLILYSSELELDIEKDRLIAEEKLKEEKELQITKQKEYQTYLNLKRKFEANDDFFL